MRLEDIPHRVFLEVKEWMTPALTSLTKRLDALEGQEKLSPGQAQEIVTGLRDELETGLTKSLTEIFDQRFQVHREETTDYIRNLELPPGPQGEPGEPGQPGEPGINGADGKDGVDGQDGKDGKDGVDGKDGINGKDGSDGINGKDGERGERGADGVDGKSVTLEELKKALMPELKNLTKALTVDLEVSAEALVEKKFQEMPKPKDGMDGRDALDIEVQPAIDPEKSYPRGTWASHKGGLWRAFQKTNAMRGWECMVNGFAGESTYEIKDNRTVEFRFVQADGTERVVERKFPGLIYRGVYTEKNNYVQGDVVSCGGSMWVAEQDNPGKPGVDHKGWTLSVKRGRDGRNAPKEE